MRFAKPLLHGSDRHHILLLRLLEPVRFLILLITIQTLYHLTKVVKRHGRVHALLADNLHSQLVGLLKGFNRSLVSPVVLVLPFNQNNLRRRLNCAGFSRPLRACCRRAAS